MTRPHCLSCGAPQNGADWQPIETAPKDGRLYFALIEGCSFPLIARYDIQKNHPSAYAPVEISPFQGGNTDGNATHWMPLPAPPEAE